MGNMRTDARAARGSAGSSDRQRALNRREDAAHAPLAVSTYAGRAGGLRIGLDERSRELWFWELP